MNDTITGLGAMRPESAEIGRLLDLLSEGDREMVRDLVNRLSRRSI